MSDELRTRLTDSDPMHPGVPTEPLAASTSRTRMERIMSVQQDPSLPKIRVPNPLRWAVAVGAVMVVAITGLVVSWDSDGADPDSGSRLDLAVRPSTAMASCLAFDVSILADMPMAFQATAVDVGRDSVELSVDRWFTGGDADTVVLATLAGEMVSIDGVTFEAGEQYLVTAEGGTVNGCGFSAKSTPELLAAFEEAFSG